MDDIQYTKTYKYDEYGGRCNIEITSGTFKTEIYSTSITCTECNQLFLSTLQEFVQLTKDTSATINNREIKNDVLEAIQKQSKLDIEREIGQKLD